MCSNEDLKQQKKKKHLQEKESTTQQDKNNKSLTILSAGSASPSAGQLGQFLQVLSGLCSEHRSNWVVKLLSSTASSRALERCWQSRLLSSAILLSDYPPDHKPVYIGGEGVTQNSALETKTAAFIGAEGFPGGSSGQEFDPWVRKVPWRRKWQPTPVILPGKAHGQRSPAGYSMWGLRVRHDWGAEYWN